MMVGNPWEKFVGPRAFHSGQRQSSMAAAGRPAAGDGFLLVNPRKRKDNKGLQVFIHSLVCDKRNT